MRGVTSFAEKRPATRAEARALAHPLRLRILRLCLDESLTNLQLAERLGTRPATVLYHVRTLVRTGFLQREEERRGRRGAREIPYRSTRKSWTLSFEPDPVGNLAILDATRAELIEAGPDGVLELVRLALRLAPDQLEALGRRVRSLVDDTMADDGSGEESIGILITVHRRR
jgi:predicted ArsR family transcriptional regulator